MKISNNRATYGKLNSILNKKGFHIAGKQGSHNIYAHNSIDSIIVLPNRPESEIVKPVHVVAIKRALVDNGLIDVDQFDNEINSSTVQIVKGHGMHVYGLPRTQLAKNKHSIRKVR